MPGLPEYFVWGRFEWNVTEGWRIAEKREPEVVDSVNLEQGNSLIRIDRRYAMSDKIDLRRLDVLLGVYMPTAGLAKSSMGVNTRHTWAKAYAIILDGHHKLERALHEGLPVNVYRLSFKETLEVQVHGPRPTKTQLTRLRDALKVKS